MKNFSVLLLILMFILCFSKTQLFAQSNLKPKEVIIFEFSGKKDIDGKIEAEIPTKINTVTGQTGFSECLFCTTQKEFDDFKSESYEYFVQVSRLGRNESEIYFKVELDTCKTRKGFMLHRNKKSNFSIEMRHQYHCILRL